MQIREFIDPWGYARHIKNLKKNPRKHSALRLLESIRRIDMPANAETE